MITKEEYLKMTHINPITNEPYDILARFEFLAFKFGDVGNGSRIDQDTVKEFIRTNQKFHYNLLNRKLVGSITHGSRVMMNPLTHRGDQLLHNEKEAIVMVACWYDDEAVYGIFEVLNNKEGQRLMADIRAGLSLLPSIGISIDDEKTKIDNTSIATVFVTDIYGTDLTLVPAYSTWIKLMKEGKVDNKVKIKVKSKSKYFSDIPTMESFLNDDFYVVEETKEKVLFFSQNSYIDSKDIGKHSMKLENDTNKHSKKDTSKNTIKVNSDMYFASIVQPMQYMNEKTMPFRQYFPRRLQSLQAYLSKLSPDQAKLRKKYIVGYVKEPILDVITNALNSNSISNIRIALRLDKYLTDKSKLNKLQQIMRKVKTDLKQNYTKKQQQIDINNCIADIIEDIFAYITKSLSSEIQEIFKDIFNRVQMN